MYDDTYFMKQALQEARRAFEAGEVPVGAVMVCRSKIVARSHNQTELLNDVTAHAEILAMAAAANALGAKYLPDYTLYVTLEPCPMCAGALAWAQLGRLVYAAADSKRGFSRFAPSLLHVKTQVETNLLAEESAVLLRTFFEQRR